MTEREFIESIRQDYSGLRDSPRVSLNNSIKTLAADLYAKDTHFIFELIQNAEDNAYEPSKKPNLRFEVRQQEIDGESSPVLIVHNNETGFREEHVQALCRVGESTKKKAQGYIGEKGIGFKSVFRITECPYVFSNGFQFRLPEHDQETGLGYIVPRWVANPPAGITESETTIILPLNGGEEVVQTVVVALRDIAPETILFLNQLKSIEIAVHLPEDEYEVVIDKNIQAVSVELTYLRRNRAEDEVLESSLYWVTEVEFPKPAHVRHEKRAGIDARTLSVAIPLGPTAHKGKLFAYLPVWEDTGLPFLINADFLLVSSREEVREDEAWNKWLRDCIAETYVKAFLSLLNAPDLPVETKISTYASIPLETHRPFLAPIVEPIQKCLESQDCVLVLSDRSLARPSRARLCDEDFRAVLGSSDSFPRYCREDAWLVSPEIERFSRQLKAIGVKSFLPTDVVTCLQDTAWVQGHELAWFVSLFRYLESQKFESATLRSLGFVPVAHPDHEPLRFSCAEEQPIYFLRTEADLDALAHVPGWLSELAPIAFLDPDFLRLLDQQADREVLRKWATDALNVCDFSIERYCGDVLSRLAQDYIDLEENQVVEATAFLALHAGSKLDWENLPIILSDGRKMLLRDARTQTKYIVVPEDFDPDVGWRNIWTTSQDRTYFLALANHYRELPAQWFEERSIPRYPGFRQVTYDEWSQPPLSTLEYNLRIKCLGEAASSRWYDTSISTYLPPSSFTQYDDGTPVSQFLSQSLLCFMRTIDIPKEDSGNYREKLHQLGFLARGTYHNRGEKTEHSDSSVLLRLRTLKWLPSSLGLVPPSQAFLPKQGIKEIFGGTVAYFEGDLPENTLRLLGVSSEVTEDGLLARLREHSGTSEANPDMIERIYSQLAARPRTAPETRAQFSNAALVLVKDSHGATRWCKTGECVWDDASAVFGDAFAYLKGQYPKLQEFFVERLGVKREVDQESFARQWLKLQADPVDDIKQQRVLVAQLYLKIKSVAQTTVVSRPQWWRNFSQEVKVYTQSDTFERPTKVLLPDDGELRDIFEGNRVEFAWRPEKDAFNDWAPLYTALGTPLLSESVTENLHMEVEFEILPDREFVTDASVKMIAAWLREKRPDDYERILRGGTFDKLASLREARTTSGIVVEFRLKVNSIDELKSATYPAFWKREDNILIYSAEPKKNQIAKAIAKALISNRAYKDLAHWIELVLGASDVDRLKDENWNVPDAIHDLFSPRAPISGAFEALQMPVGGATTAQPLPGATGPLTNQPVRETSPQEPAPKHVDGPVDASKDDVERQTPGTPDSDKYTQQGGQNRPRTVQGPHSVNEHEPEEANKPATDHDDWQEDNRLSATPVIPGFDYAAALAEAFNQPGKTKFDDEEDFEDHGTGNTRVKNSQRRGEKLAEGYRDSISNEPSPDDRRRVTEQSLLEGPNEAVRVSLYEWYRGKCQICSETWPERDGEPYFTAAYLVERRHARWLDEPGNAICLCAEHFAQWRHAAKEMPLDVGEQIRNLRRRAEGGNGDLSIEFTMLGEDVAISYDERHFLALRKFLEVTIKATENHLSD